MALYNGHSNKKLIGLVLVGLFLVSSLMVITPVLADPGLTFKWVKDLGYNAQTYVAPVAADINNDGNLEIVVTGGITDDPTYTGTTGTVTALDGDSGDIVWQVAPGGVTRHTPVEIADINNDGFQEIIVSGSYPSVLFGTDGSIYWQNTEVSSYSLYSVVCDIDGNGYSEIFVNSGRSPWIGDDYFTMLSYDGSILRQQNGSWHPCWGGLTIGDANFDGQFELYQGDRRYGYSTSTPYILGEWGVRALDAHTLTPLWNDDDITCSSHCPMLADVDKDGILDVIATHQSTSNGGLIVLNAITGEVSTAYTSGTKYRKDTTLGLASHSQPTIYDIDGDGNLEIITCRSTNPKIWDLYDWKLDAILPVICTEPPKIGDVTGDGEMDIIAVRESEIYIYSYDQTSSSYIEVDHVTGLIGANSFSLIQDVDGDNLNELVLSSSEGLVYCYDTTAPVANPKPRSGLQFSSERHCGVAEYVMPPGPLAPQISNPSPLDSATNIPVTLSELSFTLSDFQNDPMNYSVTTTPNIGSGSGINVNNGMYTIPISDLDYSTLYTWQVTATDGEDSIIEVFTFTTESQPLWWDPNWAYRRAIAIDPSQVSSDQTDFPLLIDLTASDLNGKTQPDGGDFVFTDADNVKLDHEIESYDYTTGHLVVWVNVPYLSSTAETVLYMYYGNLAAANQENPTAVWDTSYRMVLHLNETVGIQYDSTVNDNDGSPFGGISQGLLGKIAGADLFDGVDDYVQVSHNPSITGFTEAFTVSFWLKLQDTARRQTLINKYNTAGSQRGWFIEYQTHSTLGEVFGFFASQDGASYREWYASFVPTADTWYYITVVWESGVVPKFYVDGSQLPTIGVSTLPSIFNNELAPLHIGRSTYTPGRYLDGILDEIRISNPTRSPSYILTSFNNQKDPNTFHQVGLEETLSGAPVITNPSPPDGATGVDLNPTLSITALDYQGDPLTIIFQSNVTGFWEEIGSYTDVGDGTYTQDTTSMNSYNTQYWWSVHVTDGVQWSNQTFNFKTKPEPAIWWDTDWQYRRIITIDPSKVSADQTDFPVVIDLTDSELTSKAQDDGDDFVFTDESNVKLCHEIEAYDYTTGHLIVWVKVPYLSSTSETVLYMYYGNPTASNQEDPMAVWDPSYKLVLHLSETHECRMWGMISDVLPHDVVLEHLITDPSSLKVLGASNRDGWALVWYDSITPEIRRGFPPASSDPNFDSAANEMADSGAWVGVGHVRARSQGAIPPEGNPHPFMRYKNGKWWAFEHNGNVNKEIMKSLIGPEYLVANPPTVGTDWDDPDVVDSDLYGLYVLKCIEENNWNVTVGIAKAITDITEAGADSGANFLLTNGEKLWGFRLDNTLYYYYQATQPQYSAVASQPPDSNGWVALSNYNLVTLTKANPPSVIPDIRIYYPLLVDSDFIHSVDSEDLRDNTAGQDWYESRDDVPEILYLDESDIGGNTGKKAGFLADPEENAYLTQEFSSAQTGTFSVQWDIYVDEILNIGDPDRSGIMLIGDDSGGTNGPNSGDGERFVFLAFHKDGGATSGIADLVWMDTFSVFTPIASVNLDQWYTIKVDIDVVADTYDVYLDGVFIATVPACTAKASLTHISFAQWDDGAGSFYVDNVYSPTADRYRLTINTEGDGSVIVDPAESSYPTGANVTLIAVPDPGAMFNMWNGDASGSQNPITITMDGDKTVIAKFTETLLSDSEFNDSLDSDDLRDNTAGQDWYESRNDDPTILFLDESDVGGNAGKKAEFVGSTSGNAYVTQEFSSAQTGTFSVQWDIYVDEIIDISDNPDRAGFMLIGDDSGGTNGPNSATNERFVFMSFYKDGGATSGAVDLVAMSSFSSFTTIASVNLDQWYTIKVVIDVVADTYAVYLDGVWIADVSACTAKAALTHISFAQWNDGAGTFYVDNVFSPAQDRHKLTVNVVGSGSVTVNPGESTYSVGAQVNLTAIADYGWIFSDWSGDLAGSSNPATITMDGDKVITATFTIPQYTLTINVVGSGTVTKNPDKSTYNYGESVELAANPTVGWSFLGWSGDLSSSENPTTIIMDSDKVIIARFVQEGICIDSTVNGNDGLLYGGITQGALGQINSAYEFDGVDDYIEVPHSGTLTGYDEAFTASFWLKLDDTTRRQAILNKYDTAGNQRGWLIEYSPSTGLGLFASETGTTYRQWHASFTPTAGTWYYITVVWESNEIPQFYVDGSQVATLGAYTLTSIFNNVAAPLDIGRSTYNTGRYLDGVLDEIRISNPTKSPSYILTSYNNQKDPAAFYQVGLEETLPTEPFVSDPYPADEATNIPITLTELSFNLTDYQDLMDYYVSTYPDIGSDSASGVGDGRYTVAVSGLQYQTTYTWYVNVTDGTEWTNKTFTFTTRGELLTDAEFNDSIDSADLRANSPEQDWYESREEVPTLLSLDESDVGGNSGKKAGFAASASGNAYCTQEFSSAQTGTFSVQWDIYVDSILDVSPRRAGQMMIGTSNAQYSPNRNDAVRFVFLAFYKPGGGTSGTADLVAMLDFDTQVLVASGLNLDQWYTIKVEVNVGAGTYNVYVDDIFMATVDACTALSTVTHISFAQWNDGAGTFYVDNVFAQTINSPPAISVPEPANEATGVSTFTSLLNFTLSDAEGESMDYYVSTSPDIGSDSTLGVFDGTYNLPVSGLAYDTEYTWWLNVTDGTDWTNMTYTFTTESLLLVDSMFDDSVDTADLRADGEGQDWYESRGDDPTLLVLNDTNVGGNAGKKAEFIGDSTANAYASQEFSSAQTGTFTVQWDIYVDEIIDISGNPDRAGFMLIGDDSGGTNGPNSGDGERFVFLAFYKDGGATSGAVDLVAMSSFSSFTTIASVNLDQWYTIKVVIDVGADTYEVYLDGVKIADVSACTAKTELTHISFAQWNDGTGTFYVDNVYSPTVNHAPEIDSYYPISDPAILEGESQLFNVTYHDVDGDPLAVQWLLNGSDVGAGDEYTFAAGYSASGIYNVTVVVSDGELSAKNEWTLTVSDVGPNLLMPFDSDESPVAVDESGYGNNGTVFGPQWSSDYGGCYFFDASELDYIEIPDDDSLDGAGTWTEITVEFWIKPTIDNNGVRLIEKRSAGSSYQIGFQTTPSPGIDGNQLYWNVWTSTGYKEIVAPFGLETDEWSQVICTYKDGVGMAIYVNASLAISASHTGTINDSTCPINIGRRGDDSSYFTGFMDDTRLYIKALPEPLIQQNYEDTKDTYVEVNHAPEISGVEPSDLATGVPVSTSLLNFTLSDADAELMDYYLSTVPDVGSGSALGVSDGAYSLAVSGLEYGMTYSWWVNVTDGTDWTNSSFTFTTEGEAVMLVDSEFDDSADTADLIDDGEGQDWYESRGQDQNMELDITDVGGNAGNKVKLSGGTDPNHDNVYLTQELSSAQTGTFSVQWDIYVDTITDIGDPDRSGFMLLGADLDGSGGPNRNDDERFVFLAFFKDGGATTGTADLVAMSSFSSFTTIAADLNLDQWYTVKVEVDVAAGTYDVYVDGVLVATDVAACTALASVTHISFAQWNDGAGAFYVDNIYSPAGDRYKLSVTVDGDGSVDVTPSESSYTSGAEVTLTATADDGWEFSGWTGDLTTTDNPTIITMDSDKTVTAVFTAEANIAPEVSGPEPADATTDVPISTSLLNFTIADGNLNFMDYYVSTIPDIGSDAAMGVSDGTYSVPVSGLDYGMTYTWWVNVTDGTDWTNMTYTFTCALLGIEADFDSASIGTYIFKNNEINFTLKTENLVNSGDEYTYWTHFKVTNTLSKEITFRITNADAVPFLSTPSEEAQMVFSYNGEDWFRFATHSYSNTIYTFTETFTEDEVYVATFFPFSYTKMQSYIDSVTADSDATKTVLGSSEEGRDITLIKITNATIPDTNKKVIYIIGRQHAHETASSHMLKGMIDFLISDSEDAQRLKDDFVWYIVPMVNPDGVYLGNSRGTSEGRDPNRDWMNSESVEINIVRDHIDDTSSTHGIDFFIDWHSQMSDDSWYNYVYSPPGNTYFSILSVWTDFDTQFDSAPDTGSTDDCTAREYISHNIIYDPMFVFEPTPHLHTWTITSLEQEGVNVAYAINEYFPPPTESLLVDSAFDASANSEELRDNGDGQDWYESRNDLKTLLTLDENEVEGNAGKKAALKNYGISSNAYLTQEFGAPKTGELSVSFDIYVDRIDDSGNYDRSGLIYIGDDSVSATNPPAGTSNERFVFMTFYDSSPGDTGDDLQIRARTSSGQSYSATSQWTSVATDLSYDTWYTIKIDLDVAGGTFDVYVDGVLVGENIPKYNGFTSTSITHISLSADSDGRGDFYIDNVFSPPMDRYKLSVIVDGDGSVDVDPSESSYAAGSLVSLTPTAGTGYMFDHWELDATPDGSEVPYTVTMDSDHAVTAVFVEEGNVAPEITNPEPADAATDVPVSTSLLNFTLSDADAELMDYYLSTVPDVGSGSALGVSDGAYSLAVSGLEYGMTYSWWVNVTDGTDWTNSSFTFTTEDEQVPLLVDSEFDDSISSEDLRTNSEGQDWYESREDGANGPLLLYLDESDVGGNAGKKAGFIESTSYNAYMSQEFSKPQTGTFTVQWDIYVDSISAAYEMAGFMFVGDYNPSGTRPGPNSDTNERFVRMCFYKAGGGDTGTMTLIGASTSTVIAEDLNLDQWYTIKVVCDLSTDTYDVYVDGVLEREDISAATAKTSVTHVSFAQWNDGAGAFYIDNVYSPAQD